MSATRLVRLACLCGLSVLLICGHARGATAVFSAEPEIALGAAVEILDDPAGRMGLAEAMAVESQNHFRKSPSRAPNLGSRPGATWVRFELHNPGPGDEERWLNINSVYLTSYILHLVDAAGRVETQRSGAEVLPQHRPLASRMMIFRVRLKSGESRTAYLRFAGRAPTIIDLTLWEPAAYLDHLTLLATVKYLGLGATFIVVVFSVLAYRARQRNALLAIIPGHLLTVGVVLWGDGFGADWIPEGDGLWYKKIQMLMISLAIVFHALFAREFLALSRYAPRWDVWVRWLTAAFLVLTLGAHGFGGLTVWVTYGQILMTVILSAAGGRVVRERGAAGYSYLAAWGTLWGSFIARQIQALGWMPNTASFGQFWLLGLWVASITLFIALYLEVRAAQREAREVQTRLLELQQDQSTQLALAVEQRTEELRLATERAETANRAKSLFLSMVSHEFRTPLHNILGYSHVLSRRGDASAAESLGVIERSGEQLLGLIDEVLAYTRGESKAIELHPRPLRIRSLLEYLQGMGRLKAEKNGNRFVTRAGPDLPSAVIADEQRLIQVLSNLIENACKYTENGTVTLSVQREDSPDQPQPAAKLRRLRFAVIDDGIGISEEDRGRVFEAFGRASEYSSQPGVGLGLSIARQYVDAMGADIELESSPGEGSCFSFVLELEEATETAARERADGGRITGYRGRRRRLLVADDLPENRVLLRDILELWGFDVILAQDGCEAAEYCSDARMPLDAALVDQFMPNAGGWEFLAAVRTAAGRAYLPVILVSAAAAVRPPDVPESWEFDAILSKPVTAERLADVLGRLFQLDWIFAAREEQVSGEIGYPRLPPDLLADFSEMIELGRVTALEAWAESLYASRSEFRQFAEEVQRLCRAVNLKGLQRLSERVA